MSYQVLARKWRPNCFAELVGQEHVVAAISNALDNDRLHHAYLFTGTRGVGKTTIARIFSKSLNCELGQSASPCGKCSTCVEIEQGNFIDLLEIDAASRTKVEDTRELLDNVQYRPSRGRYKVYLIDEVHMLSKHSFNALLKTLEEPPPHVKFLLATTDPQKLPVTILSRCLQFNLKALSRTQIAQQLSHILQQEQFSFDNEALAQLARAAQGSMRDALSLTDQAIAQGNGEVSLSVVTDMLGLMDKNLVLKLLNAVLQKNAPEALQLVDNMASQSADFGQVMAELMSLLHQVALTQMVPDACKLETIAARAIFQIAKSVAPEHIQLLYQIALGGKKDLPHAADARIGVEMTLLRMMAFSPGELVMQPEELAQYARQTSAPSDAAPVVKQAAEPQTPEAQHIQQDQPAAELIPEPIAPPLVAVQQAPVTAPVAQQATPVAPEHSNDDVQGMDDSEYEQQLFEQQQAIWAQSEDYGYPVNDGSAQTVTEVEQPGTEPQVADSQPLNTTASLIALRKKLLASQVAGEGNDTPVKKSQTSDFSGLANLRQRAPAEPPPTVIQPPVAPAVDSAPVIVAKASQAPVAERAPLDLSDDEPYASEAEESYFPAPEYLPEQDYDEAPPWTIEQHGSLSVPSNDALEVEESVEQDVTPLELPADELAPVVLDAHGHLALDQVSEVTIDIPVFLADQQKVTSATQIDSWSQLIQTMQITALTKQLALHAAFEQQADKVKLSLPENKQHLITPSAQQQLREALSAALGMSVQLEIELGKPINTPFAIQQNINIVRQNYARQVVASDANIALLQELFAAKIDELSIQAK